MFVIPRDRAIDRPRPPVVTPALVLVNGVIHPGRRIDDATDPPGCW